MRARLLLIFVVFLVSGAFTQEAPSFSWVNGLESPFSSLKPVKVISDGNFLYTLGDFKSVIDFDSGSNTNELFCNSNRDVFVLKTDLDGSFVWVKQLRVSLDSKVFDVEVNSNGELAVLGNFRDSLYIGSGANEVTLGNENFGVQDNFIVVLDSSGDYKWSYSIPSSAESADIEFDELGNLYFVSNFNGTIDFNPGVGVQNHTAQSRDMCLVKFNSFGHYLWTRVFPSKDACVSRDMEFNPSGNLVLVGYFRDSTDFDPGPNEFSLIPPNGDIERSFMLELNPFDGSFVDMLNFGGNNSIPENLEIDDNGNMFISGVLLGVADFDLGPGQMLISSPGGIQPGTFSWANYFFKVDMFFTTQWVNTITSWFTYAKQVMNVKDNGHLVFASSFKNTIDCNPGVQQQLISSNGNEDWFIQEYDQNGELLWTRSEGGSEVDECRSFCIGEGGEIYLTGYNNGAISFDSTFFISNYGMFTGKLDAYVGIEELDHLDEILIFPNPSSRFFLINSKVKIEGLKVFDSKGKKVLEIEGNLIDLTNFSSGVYTVMIEIDGEKIIQKLFKR